MSTSKTRAERLGAKTALLVGAGGLGCPAAIALVHAGVGRLLIADDDIVDWSNLHRQILFDESHVGLDKTQVAIQQLKAIAPQVRVESVGGRLLPHNAGRLVRSADVVIEGADNFATKFLVADAAYLNDRPVIHGAAIRWRGTAMCVAPAGAPCYRCLFEEALSGGDAPNCDEAGVVGPVVGIAGAMMADLALSLLTERPRYGEVVTLDGKRNQMRSRRVHARRSCQLCGSNPTIRSIDPARYSTRRTCSPTPQTTAVAN